MSCGQVTYTLTLLESALRFLLTSGLTTVLRDESRLDHEQEKKPKVPVAGMTKYVLEASVFTAIAV